MHRLLDLTGRPSIFCINLLISYALDNEQGLVVCLALKVGFLCLSDIFLRDEFNVQVLHLAQQRTTRNPVK